jgi:hypothetical protein
MEDSSLSRRELIRLLAGLGVAAGVTDVLAQDAAKVDPRGYKVLVDNDQVRVLEYIGKPRLGVCGQGMHSHPDHVTVVMSDVKAKVTLPDGKTFVAQNKAGRHVLRARGHALGREHRRPRYALAAHRAQDRVEEGIGRPADAAAQPSAKDHPECPQRASP